MSAILKLAGQGYVLVFEEFPDPRTKTWCFVAKPYEVFTLLAIYLTFASKWGPQWMKTRPAFNLDKLMIVYNAFQVLINAYIFIMFSLTIWISNYKWICEPIDFSNNKIPVKIATIVHLYFMVKVLDLLDTVFFILRKKLDHVTFLHVYHHAGMVLLGWVAATYIPGLTNRFLEKKHFAAIVMDVINRTSGHGLSVGAINTFVHAVMYTYYLLTVAAPSIKQSLWWKKYITQLQILQFFLLVVHIGSIVFKSDCAYPRWTAAIFLPQNFFMLILFVDFYIKTYVKKQKN